MKLEKILNLIEPPISGEWGIDVSELSKNVAKVIRTTNFTNIGKIDYAKEVVLREIEEKKILNKKLLYGDIIVEKSGGSPTQPVGRVVYFDLDTDENYLCNNFTSVLRPKNDKVHSKYLFWMLFYQHLSKKTLNFQNKTTGIINLKLDRYVKEIQIPLPPLDIQKKIADTLDKAQELIDKRKEQISALDKFLENLFLDMFGDPVSNPMGWEISYIEQLVLNEKGSIKRGPFGGALKKEIFVNEGYLVYEQYHALNNDFSFERYYITEKKFNELKGFEVKEGDIIISCSGVYLGKLAVIPKNHKKGIINQALLKISLNESKMKNIFYKFVFTHPNFKNKYFANTNGSGIPNFPSMEEFKKFKFILPPLDLQNQFASIVEKVEAEKTKLEASLKEMEDNFNSIMQRAFKGELF